MGSNEFPRRFVPAEADMGDWEQVRPYFERLEAEPLDGPEQLEAWLLAASELSACLSEERARRYVAMTRQTDDPQREMVYLDFVENLLPKLKPRWHALHQRYASSPARQALPRPRYEVLDRSTLNAVSLFRDENVPLQVEEDKLEQRYQKIIGAQTVAYDGREQTLQQMARYQEEPNRAVRQETWELATRRRLQDRAALEDIFDQLVRLRQRMAVNAGFDDYRGYAFRLRERFDYGPDDCLRFHEAVEEVCVPAMRELQRRRQRELGVETLRPWDLAVDPRSRPPLRPFETCEELWAKCRCVFGRIAPAFALDFEHLRGEGLLDLDSRKGKAPGGYQETFDERRQPFIFMNAVGLHRDVETLLHEGGHAFHSLACRHEPLVGYRNPPIEFAEVASMGMELLAFPHLDEFYSGDDLRRARREQLEGIIGLFPWIATVDAFQHWIYSHPEHSREERTDRWLELRRRFGGIEDYDGYQDVLRAAWQRQLHLYLEPFYYIEYGIAQIGALQVWRNATRDTDAAVARYRAALALGGSRPLPELYAAAGIRFDFSAGTIRPLIEAVREELARADD